MEGGGGGGGGGRPDEAPKVPEDFEWLSSISPSHLDLLVGLKELAIIRAKNAGCEELAEKFDLRMIRALGAVLLEYLKERIKNESIFPDSSEGFKLLNMLDRGQNCTPVTITEDLKGSILISPK